MSVRQKPVISEPSRDPRIYAFSIKEFRTLIDAALSHPRQADYMEDLKKAGFFEGTEGQSGKSSVTETYNAADAWHRLIRTNPAKAVDLLSKRDTDEQRHAKRVTGRHQSYALPGEYLAKRLHERNATRDTDERLDEVALKPPIRSASKESVETFLKKFPRKDVNQNTAFTAYAGIKKQFEDFAGALDDRFDRGELRNTLLSSHSGEMTLLAYAKLRFLDRLVHEKAGNALGREADDLFRAGVVTERDTRRALDVELPGVRLKTEGPHRQRYDISYPAIAGEELSVKYLPLTKLMSPALQD